MCPNPNNVYDIAPVNGLPEGLPETEIVEPAEQKPAPQKTFLRRLAGAGLAILCLVPFFLSICYIVGTEAQSAPLLSIFGKLFASDTKLLGILPVLAHSRMASLGLYALIAGLAVGAVCGILALLIGKSCFLRVGTFFSASTTLAYALAMFILAKELDIIVLAVAALTCILFVILAFKARGKRAFGALLNLACSAVVALALVISCTTTHVKSYESGINALHLTDFRNYIRWAILGLALLSCLYAALRTQTEKGRGFDQVRCIIMLVLSLFVLALGVIGKNNDNTYLIATGAAVVLSLVQVIVIGKRIKSLKGDEPDVVEEIVEAVEEEFIREEFAEATPYEGGPVEGVALAEEVNPTFTDSDVIPEVYTAGYDFYNSKSFDPFIAILNTEERNQFTELFILKYKGVMPEIPDYVVGGDNKEFFRKLFIYLGQYRDRIPDGLLAKIYQFAIKLQ